MVRFVQPTLLVDEIQVDYVVAGETLTALSGVSMQVDPGEFVALLGPSGSGKSTLLRAIAGLEGATAGRIEVEGVRIDGLGDEEMSGLRRRRIGLVHQSYEFLPDLTLFDNVGLPLALDSVPRRLREERVGRVLDRLAIGDLRTRHPDEVSGGQLARAALARALVIEPALVLADEPTGNLDRRTGASVLDLMSDLNDAGLTFLVATHDPEIAALAGRCIRLVDGTICTPVSGCDDRSR
jgi:putative ABC transport system ATP-binding protein